MKTAELHAVRSGGVNLHVEEAGVGPAVIFGHGMFCQCRMFDPVAPHFLDTHRVVTLDFPGHGQSGDPPGPMSLYGLADDYLAVMDALDIDQAVIAGFSMGGMAAMRVAAAHPERLRGLALINTTAHAQSFHERQLMKALGALARRIGSRPSTLRSVARLMFSESYRKAHPEVVAAWTEHLAGIRPETVAKITRMIAERDSFTGRLPAIRLPVLVIGSTADAATPLRQSRSLARHLPDARLAIFDTGHGTPLECPLQVTDRIYAFLAEIGH